MQIEQGPSNREYNESDDQLDQDLTDRLTHEINDVTSDRFISAGPQQQRIEFTNPVNGDKLCAAIKQSCDYEDEYQEFFKGDGLVVGYTGGSPRISVAVFGITSQGETSLIASDRSYSGALVIEVKPRPTLAELDGGAMVTGRPHSFYREQEKASGERVDAISQALQGQFVTNR